MIEKILDLSVRNRWFVVLVTGVAGALGVWSLPKLPIDAVPDITNNQVQINTVAPALSPVEIEKQVTFPIETALAGIAGLEYTRSLSRNGFCPGDGGLQPTSTNIYFARQQVERAPAARPRQSLPPGAEPRWGRSRPGWARSTCGRSSTQQPGARCAGGDGEPGWQSDGCYLTPEGERLRDDFERAAYLRTVQDWIIRPQMQDGARRRRRRRHRRLREAVPGRSPTR